VRSAVRLAGVVLLTAILAWLGLVSGRGAGHVPAVWWANAALVSIMLLDVARDSPSQPSESGHTLATAPVVPPLSPQVEFRGPVRSLTRREWPLLLAAGFLANLIAHLAVGDHVSQALALSACDIGEAAIAAYCVAIALRDGVDLTEHRQLLQFVVFAVLAAPLIASAAAGIALHLLAGSSMAIALRWFPPSALGMSIVPPLVLGLARRDTWDLFRPERIVNTAVYLVMIAATTTIIFSRSEFALLFLVIPPLLFLVMRLGLSGGALGCCLVAAIGTWFTVGRRGGPLAQFNPSLEHRILMLQLFLATAVLSFCVVGVILADLQRAGRAIRSSELRYRSLAASMEMLAAIDPLTRLANRRRFDEVLEKEWQRALRGQSPMSLVLFDADHFKAYNDHYGHLAGDDCLRKIADSLLQMARRPADLVARFGGEEFGVILPDTDGEGAVTIAESLRQRVEELAFAHSVSPAGRVTLSGGCATLTPVVGQGAIDLLNSADEALYEAKRQGRNRIQVAVFRPPTSLSF
jgi:diguanylate cyclase (GGDEF)-like protein